MSHLGRCKYTLPYSHLFPPDDFDLIVGENDPLDEGGEQLVDADGVTVLDGMVEFVDDALQAAHAFLPFLPYGFLAQNAVYFGLDAVYIVFDGYEPPGGFCGRIEPFFVSSKPSFRVVCSDYIHCLEPLTKITTWGKLTPVK